MQFIADTHVTYAAVRRPRSHEDGIFSQSLAPQTGDSRLRTARTLHVHPRLTGAQPSRGSVPYRKGEGVTCVER